MPKLTGKQRFILVRHWITSSREYDLETYIKKVCELKGIEYTPPAVRDRPISKSVNIKKSEENYE